MWSKSAGHAMPSRDIVPAEGQYVAHHHHLTPSYQTES